MVIDPAAFVSTDYERAVTAGLFASCGGLVARGVAGVAMAEDAGAGGSPLAYASLAGAAAIAPKGLRSQNASGRALSRDAATAVGHASPAPQSAPSA